MKKNKGIFNSFKNAAEGFLNACRLEKNLRFHIVIANLICIFAYFFGLQRTQWAVLALAIILVILAELVNTAIEKTVDVATDKILPLAKLAKDIAAAAVLFTAVGAVLLGIFLFGDIERIKTTLLLIFTDVKKLLPCIFVGVLDICFLFGFKKIEGNDLQNEKKEI